METAYTKLKEMLLAVHPLSENECTKFLSIWKPISAKRKEILTVIGEEEKYLYFVEEGVQRVFYMDEQDREATLIFTYAPSFGGVLDALMLQQPSRYFYETLTPSKFLRASNTDLQNMIHTMPNLALLINKGLSNALAGVLERQVELQCYTSEEKFVKLMQRSPHILQLVPHKYLANYLGIDATNFSKLINKIKI